MPILLIILIIGFLGGGAAYWFRSMNVGPALQWAPTLISGFLAFIFFIMCVDYEGRSDGLESSLSSIFYFVLGLGASLSTLLSIIFSIKRDKKELDGSNENDKEKGEK